MAMRGFKPMVMDCGSHGMLSAAKAAKIAGVNKKSIYRRFKAGVRGEALCSPLMVQTTEERQERSEDKSPYWPSPAMDLIESLDCVRLRKWRGPVTTGQLVPTLGWIVPEFGRAA